MQQVEFYEIFFAKILTELITDYTWVLQTKYIFLQLYIA